MAEIIVTAVLGKVIETLTSTVLERLNRYKGIHQSLEKWERWLSQIQVVLLDAAQKEIVDEPVKRWLDGLRDLAYDIDDALDDMATKAMHLQFTDESGGNIIKVRKIIPTCCTSFSRSTRMHDRLNKITIKLQNLTEEKNTLGLIVKDGKSKETDGRLETSLVDASSIVGRQGDKEALLQKLLRDEPSNKNFTIVPIIGMGGIGKTTLARLLYNDPQVKDNFHLHAWVCVSVEFDVLKITNIIFRSLTTEKNQEFKDLDKLQVALQKILSEKRFLLVLDDVWTVSHATWELLLRPFLVGASGSKIIMTTRKLKLVTQLCSDQPYHPKLLSDDEALALFCQNALDKSNFDSHPSLKQHGEAIVKKCDGLPLALIALGRSLSTKANEEEWEERLNSKIWELPEENEIIPALRLSYHDLPAHLKQLFAYCSLFPKDYVFDKDELVLLWMAEGFLPHPSGTNTSHQQSIESVGRKYFEELLSRSFFLQASNEESLYVMHDLMNDLATFVAGDFFLRLNDETDADDTYTALKKYRHMSFARQEYEVYGKFKVFQKANNLRTLLAVSVKVKESWERYNLSNKILVELLLELPLLRVLNLSDYEISEIPESIGSLKHLRYLNLSQTCITHLPEQVGDLYNLQTILMRGCQNLMKLPHTFSKLKNLRHFDISDTPVLEKIPFGIGELKSLQTMSKVIIEGSNGFAITELKNLKDLHGRLSIKQLDKIENAMDAKEADLFKKKELNELEMEWGDVLDGARNAALEGEVLNMLKPHHGKLRKLTIVSYGGIEFPSWVGDPSFHRLEHVTIRGCEKCISLPPLGQLSSLKELFVEGMYAVKAIGCDLLGDAKLWWCCIPFP